MKNITLTIGGMSCGHCLNAVSQAIHSVPDVEVRSLRIGRAELQLPDGEAAVDRVTAAIEGAGYKVEGLLVG